MQNHKIQMFEIIVVVMAFAVILFVLIGCAGRAQPYGEDIYLGVEYVYAQRAADEKEKQTPTSTASRSRVNHHSNVGR